MRNKLVALVLTSFGKVEVDKREKGLGEKKQIPEQMTAGSRSVASAIINDFGQVWDGEKNMGKINDTSFSGERHSQGLSSNTNDQIDQYSVHRDFRGITM